MSAHMRLTPGQSETSSSQGQLQKVHHPALAACHHRHALAGQPGKLAAGEARVRHEEAIDSPCNADKSSATCSCQVLLRYRVPPRMSAVELLPYP